MGLHTNLRDRPENVPTTVKELPRGLLVIRLVIASIIFAVSAAVSMPAAIKVILLAVAALVAGYDVILDAINSVESGDYFAAPVVIIFVAVISFVIGFAADATAMVILYKVGQILIDYVRDRTLVSAEDFLRYRDASERDRTVDSASKPGAGDLEIGKQIESAAGLVLKILIGFAVLFAILAPLLTHLTVREAIRRALSIIVIATPASVLLSIPLVGQVGIFAASRLGALFTKAASIEKLSDIKTLIMDKAGVLAEECPKVLSVQSNILDTNTFLTFAAHAVYYSEQPIANALANATDGEYKLEVIDNFSEIPGYGVEVDIGGAHVVLATKELFISREEAVPYEDESSDALTYYMMIAGRYVGKLLISNSALDSVDQIVRDFKNAGIEKSILISEDGKEELAAFAASFGFDDAFGELDVEKKLALIDNVCRSNPGGKMYIYSNGIESHSKADIDVRVSKAGKYADALVSANSISSLPSVFPISARLREVASENAIFAVVIKAILVFLSVNGWCNIWFAMFIDCAVTLFTELNAIRVPSESLIKGLLKRRAEEDEEFEEE